MCESGKRSCEIESSRTNFHEERCICRCYLPQFKHLNQVFTRAFFIDILSIVYYNDTLRVWTKMNWSI